MRASSALARGVQVDEKASIAVEPREVCVRGRVLGFLVSQRGIKMALG